MDISRTVEPRSDQLNFDDVAVHTLTITVTEVKQGPPDQPVELHNAEFPGRPYKPGKSMRRVLIAAWGVEASDYIGRKIILYGDPTIRFGKDEVGGIRIRALSHLTDPLTVALTITRGKRAPFVVQPLTFDITEHVAALEAAATITELKSVFDNLPAPVKASPKIVAVKDAAKARLTEPELERQSGK